ncbi:hypothetical protein LC1Hm_1839 [Halomicrobium sp. LC1Hm]|nr:hypothetical protein LC1Hm_1839 [Halomicrobium sp. LC1Hm]
MRGCFLSLSLAEGGHSRTDKSYGAIHNEEANGSEQYVSEARQSSSGRAASSERRRRS